MGHIKASESISIGSEARRELLEPIINISRISHGHQDDNNHSNSDDSEDFETWREMDERVAFSTRQPNFEDCLSNSQTEHYQIEIEEHEIPDEVYIANMRRSLLFSGAKDQNDREYTLGNKNLDFLYKT